MFKRILKYAIILIASYFIYTEFIKVENITTPLNADLIVGKWRSEAKDSEMEIYKTTNGYSGKLLAGWGQGVLTEADGITIKQDSRNTDHSLRNRALLNLEFLTNLRYENGKYTDGKLYLPVIGRTIKCNMHFEGDKLIV